MSTEMKLITLQSSDGETFKIEEAVALRSQTIKHMVEDGCADNAIPLPNVNSSTLAKVIEYFKRHYEFEQAKASKEDEKVGEEGSVKAFEAEFVKVEQSELFDLILAANYLNIKELLDLTCQTVANLIKDMSPEEIRKIFNIVNDFTPAEEAEVRKENEWAFK